MAFTLPKAAVKLFSDFLTSALTVHCSEMGSFCSKFLVTYLPYKRGQPYFFSKISFYYQRTHYIIFDGRHSIFSLGNILQSLTLSLRGLACTQKPLVIIRCSTLAWCGAGVTAVTHSELNCNCLF